MGLAFLGAFIVGLSLGLLGTGGSILTVPILVFLLERPEKIAIAESLAIVGSIAFLGALSYMWNKQIHWNSVLFFGIPGMFGSYLGGCGSFYIDGSVQLILIAAVMVIAASIMMFGPESSIPSSTSGLQQPFWLATIQGLLIGCLTGFIGIGGGFILVPVLVFLRHLPMTMAVGTSLMIIAMNCLTCFYEHLTTLNTLKLHVDWIVVFLFVLIGLIGSVIGSYFNKKISQKQLKRIFGISIFAIAVFMIFSRL